MNSLSCFVNTPRIVRECRRCLGLLSGRFTSVSLVWVPLHCNIPGNCRADEFASVGALLAEFSSIELGMPLASVKLAITRKFFRDTNLAWVNEESRSNARLTWLLMDRRGNNQLLRLRRDIITITVAVLTSHCVMGRHAERMRLPFNDFCRGCRSAEEEETVILFLCQCPSLTRCRYRLSGSAFLVIY